MNEPLPAETITARLGVAWRRHLKGEETLPDFLREAMHLGGWAVDWLNAQMVDPFVPHDFVGDGADCEVCQEGTAYYLHGEEEDLKIVDEASMEYP